MTKKSRIQEPEFIFWASCCKGLPPFWPKYCPECWQYRVYKPHTVFTQILKPHFELEDPRPKDPTCAYCGHSASVHMRGGGRCLHEDQVEVKKRKKVKLQTVLCTCVSFQYANAPIKREIEDRLIKWMEGAGIAVACEEVPTNPWHAGHAMYSKSYKVSTLDEDAVEQAALNQKLDEADVAGCSDDEFRKLSRRQVGRYERGTLRANSHWVVCIANQEVCETFFLSSVYRRTPSAALAVLSLWKAAHKIRSKYVMPFDLHRHSIEFEDLVSTVSEALVRVLGPEAYESLGELVRRR